MHVLLLMSAHFFQTNTKYKYRTPKTSLHNPMIYRYILNVQYRIKLRLMRMFSKYLHYIYILIILVIHRHLKIISTIE